MKLSLTDIAMRLERDTTRLEHVTAGLEGLGERFDRLEARVVRGERLQWMLAGAWALLLLLLSHGDKLHAAPPDPRAARPEVVVSAPQTR